jgi:small subunit ribosomal protein S2
MTTKLLISRQDYLASGIYIGMKQKSEQMKEFIYNIRPDGLAVLNLKKIDDRIRVAAKFLARAKTILLVGRKQVVHDALDKLGEIIGAKVITGRFMPGTLTNPRYKKYFEADVVFITDPLIDIQVLNEAVKARVPIVAVCDTINETKDIDLIVPSNNKGKKSLATLFWLLGREILKEREVIKNYSEYKYKIEDFVKEE